MRKRVVAHLMNLFGVKFSRVNENLIPFLNKEFGTTKFHKFIGVLPRVGGTRSASFRFPDNEMLYVMSLLKRIDPCSINNDVSVIPNL